MLGIYREYYAQPFKILVMKYLRFIFIGLILFCGCNSSTKFDLGKVEYITTFDQEIYLGNEPMSEFVFEEDGVNNFRTYGPYIIASTYNPEAYILVFDKAAPYSCLGRFFKNGNGPGELAVPVLPSSFSFYQDSTGEYHAEFDNRAGKIIRFDIDRSIVSQSTVSNIVGDSKRTSFVTVDLGEDGVFHKDLSDAKDQQIRYITKDGKTISSRSMERLNRAVIRNKIDDGMRFNVLSGSVLYDRDTKRFAETPGQINAIHLYALDDSYAKTFCIGDKLLDYNEIADRENEDRPRTSISTRQFKDYIGVLYLGVAPREDRQDVTQSIILLSWDGKKNARIHLPNRVSCFDIDFDEDRLYTFDQMEEKMYVYDISSFQL